jgi:copper(I)-binding protein
MKRHAAFAVVMATMAAISGCTGSSNSVDDSEPTPPASVSITGATVVTQTGGDPYVSMMITTSSDDRLTAVEVDPEAVAGSVVLAESGAEPTPNAAGEPAPFTPGRTVDGIDLSAGEATAFGPGSYGIWLSEQKDLAADSTVTITLTLQDAGELTVEAPVR